MKVILQTVTWQCLQEATQRTIGQFEATVLEIGAEEAQYWHASAAPCSAFGSVTSGQTMVRIRQYCTNVMPDAGSQTTCPKAATQVQSCWERAKPDGRDMHTDMSDSLARKLCYKLL